MARWSKSFQPDAQSPGERFRLVPIKGNAHLTIDDPRFAYDLNADVAAALLDIATSSLRRFTREGRTGRDGAHTMMNAHWAYGHGHRARAYYSLADVEAFALRAWKRPRKVHYNLIPHWYIVKHHRLDLTDLVQTARPAPNPVPELAGLPPEERAAVEAGYPRGAYVDGDDVFSPGGVLLNPGDTESAELHELAKKEIAHMLDN